MATRAGASVFGFRWVLPIVALASCSVASVACSASAREEPTATGEQGQTSVSATQLLADHADLDIVRETPHRRIREVLLLGGSTTIVPLQVQLIKAVPDATFYVVPSERNGVTETIYRDAIAAAGAPATSVNFVPGFEFPLTDWTQDRLVRFRSAASGKAVILPVRTDALLFNEWAPFEVGVPRYLESLFPATFQRFGHGAYYSDWAVDRMSGEMYPYDPVDYAGFYHGSVWNVGYGDGGDRLVTESTMFVGALTHARMLETLERRVPALDASAKTHEELLAKLFKVRRIVPVGDVDPMDQYLYHIDLFMTVFDGDDAKPQVILGSPLVAMKEVFGVSDLAALPAFMDRQAYRMNRRVAAYERTKAGLVARGYQVTEIPILFTDMSVGQTQSLPIITFNNGLMTRSAAGGKQFVSVDFHFDRPDLDAAVARAKSITQQRLAALGLDVSFLPGGENSVSYSGLLHCTAGVIRQD